MERLAASAPHRGDNRDLYGGRCRRLTPEERAGYEAGGRRPAWRIAVPDETVSFSDGVRGARAEHLPTGCGDFILRRADGVYAYQLAAAADDGAMGITRVVRGEDLLSSTPRQIWLMGALGHRPPAYCHVPLLLAGDGRRLSKRDGDLDMGALRERFTPEELTGRLAHLAGLLPEPRPVRPAALIAGFSWARVPARDIVLPDRLRDGLRVREAPPGPVDKPFSL